MGQAELLVSEMTLSYMPFVFRIFGVCLWSLLLEVAFGVCYWSLLLFVVFGLILDVVFGEGEEEEEE